MTVLRLPVNDCGRDFIVGDIHGCTDAFWKLCREVEFDPECDRMFSVGDLIDRGPDSVGALELLQNPWFFATRGNHEQLMLDALVTMGTSEVEQWFGNGGEWANNLPAEQIDDFARIIAELPIVIAVGTGPGRFNVVHAELPVFGDSTIDRGLLGHGQIREALWGRNIVRGRIPLRIEALSRTYCGHTPIDDIRFFDSHVFIDTGACFEGLFERGRLTVVQHTLDSLRCWSAT